MSMRRSKRIADKKMDANDKAPIATRSEKSRETSTSSRQRALEARAARELAELQQKEIDAERDFKRREIEVEKALIQARLTEDLVSLHTRSSSCSEKTTERWIKQSRPYFNKPVTVYERNENGNSHDNLHDEPRDIGDSRSDLHHRGDMDPRRDEERRPKDSDINMLTCSLTKALKLSQTNNDKLLGRLTSNNLPNFSGDALDWLRFKNAYDITTRIGHYSDEENLARLQRCLQGEAWEAVAARLIATTSASDVMKVLEMRFGRSDLVLGRLIAEMKRVPKLTGLRSEVVLLATKVDNCVAAIQSAGNIGYLHSPELISEILKKLTEPLFYRWIDYCKGAYAHQPRLTLLGKYLMSEAQAICESGAIEPPPSFYKVTKNNFKPRTPFITNMIEEENPMDSAPLSCDDTVQENLNAVAHSKKEDVACVFCSEVSHSIKTCPKFKSEHIDKRWEWIVKQRLCFRCLSTSHRRDRCKSKKKCSVCNMSGHHSLLHKEKEKTSRPNDESDKETAANVWSNQRKKVYLKVVPVHIDGPTGSVSTYALLDEGSTVTLVEKHLVDQIGVDGPESEMSLQGALDYGNNMSSKVVSLTLRTCYGVHRLDRVRTVDNLTLPNYVITRKDFKFDHLKDIPLIPFEGKPSLLIGQDNWHLIVSREIKEGNKNEPVASRTLLGWVLHGFSSSLTNHAFQFSCHLRETDDELHNLVQEYFHIDSIGIKYQDNRRYSPEETRAMNILDAKSNKLVDRWETGLLWRSDNVEFPCNRRNAEHRLRIIEKTMDSDNNFAIEYAKQVQNMLDKGYAEEVPDTPQGSVWFLPHFGVRNPNKPAKLRLVHDAKAETKGVSLNSELLAGPDLLNSLLGVLMRFRERAIAVTGDIREMFMQVKIIKEDQ